VRRFSSALVALGLALACGPESGQGEASSSATSGSTGGADTTTDVSASESPPTSADDDGSTTTPADTGPSPTTGEPRLDPCLADTPPNCGPECTPIVAYGDGDGPCGVDTTINGAETFCASLGEPVDDDYRSTYYATIDDRMWFAFTNQACVETLPALPIEWTECSGAVGEPEFCACGCAQDVCGFEAEAVLLEGCGYDAPCEVVDPVEADPYSAGALCMLTALRDRTSAALTIVSEGQAVERRVYVDGDTAQHLRKTPISICTGPLAGAWDPAERCELADPQYFEDCLAAEGEAQFECLDVASWFVDCATRAAACP
jgi:hypothetical protein